MAVTQTVAASARTIPGDRRHYFARVTINNEGSASGDFAISGLPYTGSITLRRVTPTFGTATTVALGLGRAENFVADGADEIDTLTAATFHNDGYTIRYDRLTTGILYGRCGWDSAVADNDAIVEISVVEGHLP